MPLADHVVELAAVAPGGLVQVVGRQQDGAGGEQARNPAAHAGLDGRGDPRLHVRRPAAGEPAVLDRGRHERQMDRIEVAVELERPAGPAAVEADGDGRRRRMAGRDAFDGKSVGREDLGQPVADGPGIARRAGDLDQPPGRLDEPVAADMGLHAADEGIHGVHGGPL